MSDRESKLFSGKGWLYAVPLAIIAVMLFLTGYRIIQRYEGEGFSLTEEKKSEVSAVTTARGLEEHPKAGESTVVSQKNEEIAKEDMPGWRKIKEGEDVERVININTASAAELEQLPGIGETMAKRIVETRTRLGRFRRIEDIQEVTGIGVKSFEVIKPYIIVE